MSSILFEAQGPRPPDAALRARDLFDTTLRDCRAPRGRAQHALAPLDAALSALSDSALWPSPALFPCAPEALTRLPMPERGPGSELPSRHEQVHELLDTVRKD